MNSDIYAKKREALQLLGMDEANYGLLYLVMIFFIVALVLFWVVKNFVVIRLKNRQQKQRAIYFLFIANVIAWLGFALTGIYILIEFNLIATVVMLGLILIIGLKQIKNFILGVIFRLKQDFKIGDKIVINEISGTLHHIGFYQLIVKNEEDDLIYIPFEKIENSSIKKQHAKGNNQLMSINIKFESQDNFTLALKQGKQWLKTCPWIIGVEGINIKKINDNELQFLFQTVNPDFKQKVDKYLKDKINNP